MSQLPSATFSSPGAPFYESAGAAQEAVRLWYEYPAVTGQIQFNPIGGASGDIDLLEDVSGVLEFNGQNLDPTLWYQYPSLSGDIQLVDASGTQVLQSVAGTLQYNNQNLDPRLWFNYPTTNGTVLFDDASGQHQLESIDGDLFFDGLLLAKAGDIQDIAAWSDYPAIATINANNHGITGVTSLVASGLITSGSIATGAVAAATVVAPSITATTSFIAPLISVTDVSASTVRGTTGIFMDLSASLFHGVTGQFQDVSATAISAGFITATGLSAIAATIPNLTSTAIQSSDISAATIEAGFVTATGLSAIAATIPNLTTLSGNITDISSEQITLNAAPSDSCVLTAGPGNQLLINGVPASVGQNVSAWATFPAIQNVDICGHELQHVNRITANTAAAPRLFINTTNGVKVENGGLQVVGGVSCSGFINQDYNDSNPTKNTLGNFLQVGDPASVKYSGGIAAYGPITLDAGTDHGVAIGCLPAFGLNTCRIDLNPLGLATPGIIDIIGPVAITIDAGGAANLSAGGAVQVSAGSYVSLQGGGGGTLPAPLDSGIRIEGPVETACNLNFRFGGNIYGTDSIQATKVRGENFAPAQNLYGPHIYTALVDTSGNPVPAINTIDLTRDLYQQTQLYGSGTGQYNLQQYQLFRQEGLTDYPPGAIASTVIGYETELPSGAGQGDFVIRQADYPDTAMRLFRQNIEFDACGGSFVVNTPSVDLRGIVQGAPQTTNTLLGFNTNQLVCYTQYPAASDISNTITNTQNISFNTAIPGLEITNIQGALTLPTIQATDPLSNVLSYTPSNGLVGYASGVAVGNNDSLYSSAGPNITLTNPNNTGNSASIVLNSNLNDVLTISTSNSGVLFNVANAGFNVDVFSGDVNLLSEQGSALITAQNGVMLNTGGDLTTTATNNILNGNLFLNSLSGPTGSNVLTFDPSTKQVFYNTTSSLVGPTGPQGPYGTVQNFSYNYYVSNVSGSDTSGNGQIGNPYKTITYTLTQLPATQTIPVIINLACGTYTENITVNRDNVYLVGGSTSLSTATYINGSITWDATGSAQSVILGGISSIQFNNLIYNNANAFDQTLIITDCVILSASGVNAIKATDTSTGGGNGSITLQNSIIYFKDTIAVDISGTAAISAINTQITNFPLTTAGVQLVKTAGAGRISLFGCSLIQNNATSTVLPLIDITNTTASGASGMTINSSLLQYTSATSDAGTGAKCCIRYSNTVNIGSATNPGLNLIYNNMVCEGATTTNGSPGQFVVIQKTGAGNTYLRYGGNYCGSNANHLSGSATLVKTAWVALSA